jgi:hypothetical protein
VLKSKGAWLAPVHAMAGALRKHLRNLQAGSSSLNKSNNFLGKNCRRMTGFLLRLYCGICGWRYGLVKFKLKDSCMKRIPFYRSVVFLFVFLNNVVLPPVGLRHLAKSRLWQAKSFESIFSQ